MIIFITLITFAHGDFAYNYGECTFVPVSEFACPCNEYDQSSSCSLQECHADMENGELCEADQILPDGYADYEVNNCDGWSTSGYDIFVCYRPEKECGEGYIPHPRGLNSYGPWQLQTNLIRSDDPVTLEECQIACDQDPDCWAIEYRRTQCHGDCGPYVWTCDAYPDPAHTPWVASPTSTGGELWLKNECGAPTTSPTISSPSTTPTTSPPSVTPTTSHPSVPPTNMPSEEPTFAPSFAPTHSPTFAPSFSPTNIPSSEPTFAPSFAPSNVPSVKPTESPTWPSHYESALAETDNMFDDLLAHFGNSEESFLAACSDAAFGEIKCADVIETPLSGKAVVNLVGPNADSLEQQKNWVESHGLQINDDVTLYPPGYFSPSPAPTAAISCATGESLVTVDVKVGYWYGATITQLWSLAGYKCEHMSGYPKSNFGQYTTHTKQCCLPPASYTLTCSSGPTFGWGDGHIKINGNVFCDSDALKDNTDHVETHQVDLCDGSCVDASESFVQLDETCENGFIPEIAMAIDSSTISSAAEGISWQLTDACSGGNYSPHTGEYHEYIDAECCLPKGIYTLTCSTSSVFTWQKSFVLINGRQYCYGSDGAESHVINMCDGVSECPDFTTGSQGSSGGGSVTISIGGGSVTGSGSNDGKYNDLCTFANDGECDESTGFCEVGTDCTDCGNCGQAHPSGVNELKTAFFTAFAIVAFLFV